MTKVVWTAYLKYRATRRGFDLSIIEDILRFSSERYHDVETARQVVIGKHHEQLVLIPDEQSEIAVTPITIHASTRQQIRFRLKTGRFVTHD